MQVAFCQKSYEISGWAPKYRTRLSRTIENKPTSHFQTASYSNRSLDGVETQAMLMSLFTTLEQRGIHGTKPVVEALQEYLITKNRLIRQKQQNG